MTGAFIDRSNVNGTDDLKQAGVSYLYLKATEGTGFTDQTRTARRAAAHQAGVVLLGDYHFADLADPVAECDHFLSVIGKPLVGQFRPCLDLERGTAVSDVKWAEAWIGHFKSKMGYLPVLYGSTSLIGPLRAASSLIRGCPYWRAEYGPNDGKLHALSGGTQGAVAHQYTSVAHLPGLSGVTDQSVFCGAATALTVPHPVAVVQISKAAWDRAQWRLSIGKYKGHGYAEHIASTAPGEKPVFPKAPPGTARAVAWYRKNILRKGG